MKDNVEVNKSRLTKIIIDSFLTKSNAWNYEYEWRVILSAESIPNNDFIHHSIFK